MAKVGEQSLVSCVILGGATSATLQVTRSLGSRGVAVHVLGNPNRLRIFEASVYCASTFPIELRNVDLIHNSEQQLARLIRWADNQQFHCKPLLVPLSDEAYLLVARYRKPLRSQSAFRKRRDRNRILSVAYAVRFHILGTSSCSMRMVWLRWPHAFVLLLISRREGRFGFKADLDQV